jgi:tyrosyl-tRNA synthetase
VNYINVTGSFALENSGVPLTVSGSALPVDVVTFLHDSSSFFSSKSEARKMILQGGISVNEQKITDPKTIIDDSYILKDQYILVRKGKQFNLVKIKKG